jgi:integral membrane protein
MKGALLRYRVMAWITGTALLILVFIGVPMQIWANSKTVVEIFGPIHGFLFLIYLLAALDLAVRARFSILRTAIVLLAGTIPFASFVCEYRISREFGDGSAPAGPPVQA